MYLDFLKDKFELGETANTNLFDLVPARDTPHCLRQAHPEGEKLSVKVVAPQKIIVGFPVQRLRRTRSDPGRNEKLAYKLREYMHLASGKATRSRKGSDRKTTHGAEHNIQYITEQRSTRLGYATLTLKTTSVHSLAIRHMSIQEVGPRVVWHTASSVVSLSGADACVRRHRQREHRQRHCP